MALRLLASKGICAPVTRVGISGTFSEPRAGQLAGRFFVLNDSPAALRTPDMISFSSAVSRMMSHRAHGKKSPATAAMAHAHTAARRA